jgi:hypothetical protein
MHTILSGSTATERHDEMLRHGEQARLVNQWRRRVRAERLNRRADALRRRADALVEQTHR